jgi:hypothetical protein
VIPRSLSSFSRHAENREPSDNKAGGLTLCRSKRATAGTAQRSAQIDQSYIGIRFQRIAAGPGDPGTDASSRFTNLPTESAAAGFEVLVVKDETT